MKHTLPIVRSFILTALLLASLLFNSTAKTYVGVDGNPKSSDQDAAVYPNPAQDFIFVQTDRVPLSFPSDADISIEILDILGNPMKVRSEQINATTYRVDLNRCPSGYYLLVVHCSSCADTEKGLFKFLKQ